MLAWLNSAVALSTTSNRTTAATGAPINATTANLTKADSTISIG